MRMDIQQGTSSFVTHARLATRTGVSPRRVIHHDTETGQMFRWLNTNVLISEFSRPAAALPQDTI